MGEITGRGEGTDLGHMLQLKHKHNKTAKNGKITK